MEINVETIEELSPEKIYHVQMASDASAEAISAFAGACKQLGLRALITRGGVSFKAFEEMLKSLSEENKKVMLQALGGVS